MKITTIGIDLAKRVFQVHGVDCFVSAQVGQIRADCEGDVLRSSEI